MARRKNATEEKTASARSQAAVFNDLSSDQLAVQAEAETTTVTPDAEVDDSVENAKFPFNLIYEFQDLLNSHLTVLRGVQLMVCLYLVQIFYIYLHKQSGMDVISAVGFNMLAAVIAMYLSHRSLKKKYEASPETAVYPELPSFNSLYGFFIPYAFVVLLSGPSDPFFQVNLSLTNFSLRNLHPVAKVMSAFVYNYMFGDSNTMDIIQFGQVVWIYLLVEYALGMWNEESVYDGNDKVSVRRTMDYIEIHLVAIFMVNLLANPKVTTVNFGTPIVVVRVLSFGLMGALAVSAPLYYGYLLMQKGVARSAASLSIVAIFGATLYYLTNYTFQRFVENREAVHWLLDFVTASESRVQLLKSWVLALVLVVPAVFILASKNIISLNLRRKIWHFALVPSLAYPALVHEPELSALAVLGSVFVFVVLECLRCTRITLLGGFLYKKLLVFQDEKDLKGPLNLSYIFLLVGVAIPIGYGVILDDAVSMRSYLGVVALGLGDSFASIIGKRFGKINWRGESRTIEGTAAYIIVTFASFVFIDYYLLPEGTRVKNWENMVIVSLVGGAIEGSASLNDNILIPCMTLIAYELLNKVF